MLNDNDSSYYKLTYEERDTIFAALEDCYYELFDVHCLSGEEWPSKEALIMEGILKKLDEEFYEIREDKEEEP
jgi:hypothetical protein